MPGVAQRSRFEQRGQLGESDVRIPGDQRGAGKSAAASSSRMHHDAGAGCRQLAAILRIGEERQLARLRAASVPTPWTRAEPSPRRPRREALGEFGGVVMKPVTRECLCVPAETSERAAEGELQALDLVFVFLAQREGVADRDRSHRRAPHQRQTGRGAQLARVEVVDVVDTRYRSRRTPRRARPGCRAGWGSTFPASRSSSASHRCGCVNVLPGNGTSRGPSVLSVKPRTERTPPA